MLATQHRQTPKTSTRSARGDSAATVDAFARDDGNSDGLWFVSMVGSQTALKAIWASLLKQPPDTAHIIRGADGMVLSGGYQRCQVPYETLGTWTTKIARLPVSGGWHALVYTKQAEFGFEKDSFLLLAQSKEEAPGTSPPLPRQAQPVAASRLLGCAGCGSEASRRSEIVPLQSVGVFAYRCSPEGRQQLQGRPVRRRGVGVAHAAQRGRPMDRTVRSGVMIDYHYDERRAGRLRDTGGRTWRLRRSRHRHLRHLRGLPRRVRDDEPTT